MHLRICSELHLQNWELHSGMDLESMADRQLSIALSMIVLFPKYPRMSKHKELQQQQNNCAWLFAWHMFKSAARLVAAAEEGLQ